MKVEESDPDSKIVPNVNSTKLNWTSPGVDTFKNNSSSYPSWLHQIRVQILVEIINETLIPSWNQTQICPPFLLN